MGKRLTVAEFADLLELSPGTVRGWARAGFPSAEQKLSSRGRPMWTFDANTARTFARHVRKVNETFPLIGR